MSNLRYPGSQPFSEQQARIFFGREKEIDQLATQIKLEQLTVLYGKSGLGKSSLVNAGLLPKFKQEGQFSVIKIRFFSASNQRSDDHVIVYPVKRAVEAISNQTQVGESTLGRLLPEDNSIWNTVKRFQSTQGDKGLLLVFDQFEELFTYTQEEILVFRRQLAEALYTPLPQRYWDALDQMPSDLINQEELIKLQSIPELRVLFSIRSDRFHLLERLDDFLPSVLRNCLELLPLNLFESRNAIVRPARLKKGYSSPPFGYSSDALADILSFLTRNGKKEVESTQLQIICDHLAREIKQGERDQVTTKDTANLPAIISDYYAKKIAEIPGKSEQKNARILIEDQLIFVEEERRLSMYEGQVLQQITPASLQILVDGHLLRAEPNLEGGYDYELSHDTLVAPILSARLRRLNLEEKAKELAEEKLRIAARKRSRRKLIIAYTVAVVGLVLAVSAFYFARVANQAKTAAEQELYKRTITQARSLKTEGRYSSALNEIKSVEKLAQKLGDASTWQKKQDSLKQLMAWVVIAEDYPPDSAFYELQLYEKAFAFAPDAYLAELIENKRNELKERIRKEKELLRSALLDGEQIRIERHVEVLQLLSPDRDTELEEILRQYRYSPKG